MPVLGLPPLVDNMSEILILGTLPGTSSILRQEYDADPNNKFWSIMEYAAEIPGLSNYAYNLKCDCLLETKISLWDVLKGAERDGTADGDIISGTEIFNDFGMFFQQHIKIKKIIVAGTKANKYIKRVINSQCIPSNVTFIVVPSTSSTPGRNVLPYTEKCEQWKNAIHN